MTFRERLRQAARERIACWDHEHPSIPVTALHNAEFCPSCADAVVAAVLDEFVREPLGVNVDSPGIAWEHLRAQREAVEE